MEAAACDVGAIAMRVAIPENKKSGFCRINSSRTSMMRGSTALGSRLREESASLEIKSLSLYAVKKRPVMRHNCGWDRHTHNGVYAPAMQSKVILGNLSPELREGLQHEPELLDELFVHLLPPSKRNVGGHQRVLHAKVLQ